MKSTGNTVFSFVHTYKGSEFFCAPSLLLFKGNRGTLLMPESIWQQAQKRTKQEIGEKWFLEAAPSRLSNLKIQDAT